MTSLREQVHRECKDPRAAAFNFITNDGKNRWYGQTLLRARGEDEERNSFVGLRGQVVDQEGRKKTFQTRHDYNYGNETSPGFKGYHVNVEMPDSKHAFCARADDDYRQRPPPAHPFNPHPRYSPTAPFVKTMSRYAGALWTRGREWGIEQNKYKGFVAATFVMTGQTPDGFLVERTENVRLEDDYSSRFDHSSNEGHMSEVHRK